jgi:hypothetical protein
MNCSHASWAGRFSTHQVAALCMGNCFSWDSNSLAKNEFDPLFVKNRGDHEPEIHSDDSTETIRVNDKFS